VLAPPWGRQTGSAATFAEAAHLVRKGAHVDRLLEIAVEARRQEAVAAPGVRRSGEGDNRYLSGSCSAAELACDFGPVHVRKPQVEQDDVRPIVGRDADRFIPAACFERPEPGRSQHISCELPVLLVVVDDEDERHLGMRSTVA